MSPLSGGEGAILHPARRSTPHRQSFGVPPPNTAFRTTGPLVALEANAKADHASGL
ncbi:MAG TPA: hypothetical protein VF040_21005 [Ktedonobacterales bacterium]